MTVDLEMNAPDRKHRALVLGQGGVDLRRQAVLKDESRLDLAGDDGEELGGARVGVRGVDAAGLHEADGGGDVEVDQRREVLAVREDDAAAGGLEGGIGAGVEVEFERGGFRVGFEELAKAVDGRGLLG